MLKIQLTAEEVIKWMILGIKNGNIEASRKIGEEYLKYINTPKEELNDNEK